ncbi:BTB/POZ domain-containing protein At3g22104-like isoform X1 [Nicotiana tabacum]|uniref:BTB/POZ domain-containing protein At3g22104-like isoform X1 n=2 Tax=Nicotiana tabacum TaxID=4097 RepID=A0A1S4A174_TOBAC|nr:PREDICTED: BTB/POZ domain-containing protein At3g22104-like isoform X1 [Nicotiana tabacum]
MDVSCDLEVDVNGEEIFIVDKNVICSYSGRINKLFGKRKRGTKYLKVIFHDFPGGAESFELITRFCYNKGKIEINHINVSTLYCAACYMEMEKSVSGNQNLFELTENLLADIRYWTWSELLDALKQCQNLIPVASSSGVIDKYLDSLIGRVASSCETSPCPSTSSADSSGFRLSCDSKSTESFKNSTFRATWWFEDLAAFEPFLIDILVKQMVSRNLDHGILSKFLFYYQKSRFASAKTMDEKCKTMETVIEMLYLLDLSCISFKTLFGMLRITLNLKISKCSRNKLESMIGSLLDQATLDNLLLPSPVGSSYLYDVNLVLRLLKSFISKGACCVPLTRLRKVASLIDLYIVEVAPDPCLKPSKFLALVKSLPESARDSYDAIYHATVMYFEVHSGLCEEEKMKICSGLNYEKLSSEACNHLAQNKKFPSKSAGQALITQQVKLKSLLQETNQASPYVDSHCSFAEAENTGKEDQQIVLYAGKLDLSTENEKLKVHLQGMQCRVLELEKVCRKMQNQMAKMLKSRVSSHNNARSLPRLCS